MPKAYDVIHAVMSDSHTGSVRAWTLDRDWQGRDTAIIRPTSQQLRINDHVKRYAENVAKKRQGKKLRLIHNGDSIDGDHHNTPEIFTRNVLEQAEIHIELMENVKKQMDWQRGDELYYTRGTYVHTGSMEDYIGRNTNAIQTPDGMGVWQELQLTTNGVECQFIHHGAKPVKGASDNVMRNWLRTYYYDCNRNKKKPSSIIYSGHVHVPTYDTFVTREKWDIKVIHGIITPSWQAKTQYANEKTAMQQNFIGGVIHEIKADGTICIPEFIVMDS